jgi:hypothetical protein
VPNVFDSNQSDDDTEQIVINIPRRLANRAQKYADENGNTITGVVIEALDALLSGRTEGPFWESNVKNPKFMK